jgi:iduronate 2-sulfatase
MMWPALLLLLAPASATSATKMNVLFLASDDLRYQLGVSSPGVGGPGCRASVEGGKCTKMLTPNIDKLAGMSLMCHKNYVQQAVCSPTRTSLLTSRRPDATRVWDLFSYFRTVGTGGNFTTIPQLFREHGYYVQGQGKIFHPGHASGENIPANCKNTPHHCNGDDQQYSWSVPYTHVSGEPYTPDEYEGPHSWLAVNASLESRFPLSDTQIADSAIAQLDKAGARNQPFFIAVGFHRPHLPFVAPQSFYDKYPADSIEMPANDQPPKGMPRVAWSNSGELVGYGDINAIRNGSGIQPGQVLPPATVLELRRG